MNYTRFLIEHSETIQWVKEDKTLTSEALEAIMFEGEAEALWHLISVLNLSVKEGYRVTEHEFVIS